MRLITGGAYQGKLEYALKITGIPIENVIDGAECSIENLQKKCVINHFHVWIKRLLKEEKDVYGIVKIIIEDNPDIVILVDELGCGIVPIDAFDRNYREVTGRICCMLAKEATEVHRVFCGIGTVIKHA